MNNLNLEYKRKKHEIKKRLKEFRNLHKARDEDIFSELCFCILTPQAKAIYCNRAVKELKNHGLLFKGCANLIRMKLKGVRFPNNKAAYLIAARKFFCAKGESASGEKSMDLRNRLNKDDVFKTRDWLVKNIKGLGYKEASHFLRNIGLGKDMAILDVHILRNLKKHGVIRKIPATISKKTYLELEEKMRKFAQRVKIPLRELDLLFWSNQTGFVFK